MTKNKVKLYFLGSGAMAVPVVDRILKSYSFEILGICTQEDRMAGRHRELTPSPVGQWANLEGISVSKVKSVNSPEFLSKIKTLNPDILLVVSFGQIIKEELLSIPKSGCVNIHASLLPKYRGASPVKAAILNGEDETGICFMEMEKGLDTGPVFYSIKRKLDGTEYADSLELLLGEMAADSLEEILTAIAHKGLASKDQEHHGSSYVGKIKKNDGLIDWKYGADRICRMVRAYYPWPGTFFFITQRDGLTKKKILITEAVVEKNIISNSFGEVLRADKNGFIISCGSSGSIKILKLIPEGKKVMSSSEFLLGTKLEVGRVF